MRSVIVVVMMLVLASARAHASDRDAEKALTAFVAAVTDDAKTSAAYLDQCQLMILPDANGIAMAPRALVATDLVGPHAGPITWKVKVVSAHANRAYGAGFVAADVDALDGKKHVVRSLRVSALIERPDDVHDRARGHVVVAHWGVPLADDAAYKRVVAGTEPTPAAFPDKVVYDTVDHQAKTYVPALKALDLAQLASWMSGGYTTPVLIGSAPREVVTGDDSEKRIRAWPMKLASRGGVAFGTVPGNSVRQGDDGDHGAFWLATNVVARSTYKGKEVAVTYRALFLFAIEVYGEGGNIEIGLALAHFSSAR